MFQYSFTERTVPVPISVPGKVPRSVPAKTVPTVPVSGSADFRRKPLIFAGNRRKAQEPAENRRLAFVPLGSSP